VRQDRSILHDLFEDLDSGTNLGLEKMGVAGHLRRGVLQLDVVGGSLHGRKLEQAPEGPRDPARPRGSYARVAIQITYRALLPACARTGTSFCDHSETLID